MDMGMDMGTDMGTVMDTITGVTLTILSCTVSLVM